MNVKLISVTPDAEKMMGYVARVSNPSNQENPKVAGLLKYCVKHQHWSVFEQSFMTLEIETTRGLAAQILRHRSFTFQEFSQRYADSNNFGNYYWTWAYNIYTQMVQKKIDITDPIEKSNKHYYNIIKAFGELTGVPVLLNTSLNGNGQPILETEEDAQEFYKNSKLDMMIINGAII